MTKQSCVFTAFSFVITLLLCICIISTESRTVTIKGNVLVRPLTFEMANHMPVKHQNQNTTAASSFAPKKVGTRGATWCIVKPSTGQVALDRLIEYCCTQIGVDCRGINLGGACYNPSNKASDASVVMNYYYQINGKSPHNCYFSGYGLIVDQDPSIDGCKYKAI